MTNILRALFFLLTTISLYAFEDNDCEESIQFKFDERPWKKAFEDSTENATIIEYTLQGETTDNWTELVSLQRLVPIDATPEEYYNEFVKKIKETVTPAQVDSRVINSSENSIFFEWSVAKDSHYAQHEWFKLFKTPLSTLVLRYTTKKLNDVEKERPVWEKILNEATYKKSGPCP